ncbi:fructose-specific PTS system IIA-like component [Lactobacillus colini]|uniref:Fructose-specific PTS system IIA-like component n=1 Tax=Lactobacillus colini TaxID=1819254 RepID=A0ABS4MFL8_9LACO|nr:fructose PTS transporter subunit IIA [Lactobacillus colini]MBP2058481.1 fructose-specific PTS system IIA-like component [Lactobacillus colini]
MEFNSDNIILDAEISNQKEVLEKIASTAVNLGLANNAKKLTNDFLKREEEFSTGFGNGVAIPHAKTEAVTKASIIFLRLKDGIDWNSMDGKPVKLIIAIIVPVEASKEHLNTLAKLSRKIIHQEFINRLTTEDKPKIIELIQDTLNEGDIKYD